MVFLGVDVATSCGWALLRAGITGCPVLERFATVDLAVNPADYIRALAQMIHSMGGGTVGLEAPYLDIGTKRNPQTLKVLAMLVGRFQQAFESVGITPVLVPAQTWQTAVLGRFGGKKREDRKKACLLWARATFGRNLPEDAADAAGLAYYLATKERAR